jgi:hypothetical protein
MGISSDTMTRPPGLEAARTGSLYQTLQIPIVTLFEKTPIL